MENLLTKTRNTAGAIMIKLKQLLEMQLIKEALPLEMARKYVSIKRNPEIVQRLDSVLNAIKQLPGATTSRRGDRIAVPYQTKAATFDINGGISNQLENIYNQLAMWTRAANAHQGENYDTFTMPTIDQFVAGQPKDAYGRVTKISKFITAVISQSELKYKLNVMQRYIEKDEKGKQIFVGTDGSRTWDDVMSQVKQEAKEKINALLKLYDESPEVKLARENKTLTFYIVFSKHAYDVAGMSTNRGWSSCMNLYQGVNARYIQHDVKDGTMVAYLVKNDDLNIERPVARVAIKPFVNIDDESNVFYEPEERVYGTPPLTFLEVLTKIINDVQPGKLGRFKMVDTLYCDSKRELVKYGTANIEQLVANIIKNKQLATTTDEVSYILNNYAGTTMGKRPLQFSDADKLYVDAPDTRIKFKESITECPIQFKRVQFLSFTNLTSYNNFPEYCDNLSLSKPKLTDFTGCVTNINSLTLSDPVLSGFAGLQSVNQLIIRSDGYSGGGTIQSFNGLPSNITEIECKSPTKFDIKLQDLIQQLKPLNLQKLTLSPLNSNKSVTCKLTTSFEAAVKKTLSTLDKPKDPEDMYISTTKIGLERAAYYMTLQQILNDLPSLTELNGIHRDAIQGKINTYL